MFLENIVSREHRILDGYMLKEHARTRVYEWAEVVSELCDIDIERHAKQIVDLLDGNSFALGEKKERLKEVSACTQLVYETIIKI